MNDESLTCLGLDLFTARPLEGQPIDCFVIARVLDETGISYQLLTTPELDTLLCLGMLGFALRTLESTIVRQYNSND